MNLPELIGRLKQLGARPDAYSIGIGVPEANETYCLVQENGIWLIYYAERGQRGDLHEYATEEEACNAFLELLKNDESVWSR
ncbi:hypothetical protein [Nitrosomonas communis]|uniref:Uncharacterized protein n=1 Tax=Nitrosomonas communis TaxID=44574 RepID=A0A1I4TRE6_9PROT|nr:hypothetical protein [Nitrosomonas communis]SFM79372.1 hypothetical protein SAMN05421863_10541 [Nitrosomonas communis]